MSVAYLGLTAGMTDGLTSHEVELVTTSLREQRDAGQETDQWLVLVTAAVVAWQRNHHDLAANIYKGLQHSVWSEAPSIAILATAIPDLARLADDIDPVRSLALLVDQVLETLGHAS